MGNNLIFDFAFSAVEMKYLLKKLLIAVGSVMALLLNSIKWGIAVVIFLAEIIVLIIFQVFLVLFKLLFSFLHYCREKVSVCFIFSMKLRLYLWSFLLMNFLNNLFLIQIDFWIPKLIQGFSLNLSIHFEFK